MSYDIALRDISFVAFVMHFYPGLIDMSISYDLEERLWDAYNRWLNQGNN